MKYLLVCEDGNLNAPLADRLTPNDSLTILIAIDKDKLASEFDSHMKKIMRDAQELKAQLGARGIAAEAIMEWGGEESKEAHRAREEAVLLV